MFPVEPSSDKRVAAREMFEMFKAYVDAGFSRTEAMALTKVMLVNAIENAPKPPQDNA